MKKIKIALITGISGQDGSYLAKLLLSKGYKVHGIIRESSKTENLSYLGILEKLTLHKCNLRDQKELFDLIDGINPNEIYNLAAQSSVSESFSNPKLTFDTNTTILLNLLEYLRLKNSNIKFYQASSSEMFGYVNKLPINGDELFSPLSPYAVSKVSSHLLAKVYRSSYSLFISTGILFNHESYLRAENFFIKKVIKKSIDIKYGLDKFLIVGNLDVKRDFGYAPKYVEAMFLMLQHEIADDYIVCSGEATSLRDIVNYIFDKLNIPVSKIIEDKQLFRKNDIINIYGNNTRTKNKIPWEYDLSIWQLLNLLIEEEMSNFNKKNKMEESV